MGASLHLSVSESNVDYNANTSVVTATLKITATGSTWNGYKQSGYITIDGTKYTFSSSFAKGKTTTLATKSKTVAHNADGTKTVSVAGYYKTGVSAGNLSKSTTITLTAIPRYYYVYYNTNGGSGSFPTQTKYYGSGLTLYGHTPTRTGYDFLYWSGYGGNYAPGGVYPYDTSTTMTAVWAEKSATLTYYNNGHGTFPIPGKGTTSSDSSYRVTMRYSAATTAISMSETGYTFNGWTTSRSGGGTRYNAGDVIKPVNQIPSALSLYAQWSANKYTIAFNGNGNTEGSPPEDMEATYNSAFVFPAAPQDLKKTGYEFKGWATTPDAREPQYLAGDSITWKIASGMTYYAVWGDIFIPIYYYRNTVESSFDKVSTYSLYYSDSVHINYDYELPNIALPNLDNYTFSGYWSYGKPNDITYTEFGITFPTGVVPYNYEKYLVNKGFLTAGSTIENVEADVYLYPIYIDNTPSVISKLYSSYEYVPDVVTQQDYYLYLTNQVASIQTSISDENVVMATKFRTSAGNYGVALDVSNISYSLQSDDNTPIDINLNPVLYKSDYNTNLNTQDFYLIFKTTGQPGGILVDYATTSYILNVSGIKDSFGKTIEDVLLIISPPKLVRDINYNGDAIAFFDEAPDYTDEEKLVHTEDELWINGLAFSNNFLLHDEPTDPGDTYGPYALQLLDTGNITSEEMDSLYTVDNIDLSKLLLFILSKL